MQMLIKYWCLQNMDVCKMQMFIRYGYEDIAKLEWSAITITCGCFKCYWNRNQIMYWNSEESLHFKEMPMLAFLQKLKFILIKNTGAWIGPSNALNKFKNLRWLPRLGFGLRFSRNFPYRLLTPLKPTLWIFLIRRQLWKLTHFLIWL